MSDQENNEKITIEIPENYKEIAEKKLQMLELDYQNTIKKDYKVEDVKDEERSDSEEDSNNDNNENYQDNRYYQCLNDDEFVEVNEEDNFVQDDTNYKKINEDGITENCEFEFIEDDTNSENIRTEQLKIEPIKNPEKIKNAMKNIKITPPKWAQKYIII
jgi:hypothetical protein